MALIRRNILQIQRVEPTTSPILGPSISFPQGYNLGQAQVIVGPKPRLTGTGSTGGNVAFKLATTVSVRFGTAGPETRKSNIVAGTLGLQSFPQPSNIPSVGEANIAGSFSSGFMPNQRYSFQQMDPGQSQGLSPGIPWSSIASRKIITKDFFLGGEYVVPTKIETLSFAKQEFAVTLKKLGVPEGFEYYAAASKKEPKEFTALKLAEFGGAKSLFRSKYFLGTQAKVSFKFE